MFGEKRDGKGSWINKSTQDGRNRIPDLSVSGKVNQSQQSGVDEGVEFCCGLGRGTLEGKMAQ